MILNQNGRVRLRYDVETIESNVSDTKNALTTVVIETNKYFKSSIPESCPITRYELIDEGLQIPVAQVFE